MLSILMLYPRDLLRHVRSPSMCTVEKYSFFWDYFQSTTHLIDILTAAAQHWGHLPAPCLSTVGSQVADGSASTTQHTGSWDRRLQKCKYVKHRDYLVEMSMKSLFAVPFIAGYRRKHNSQISFEGSQDRELEKYYQFMMWMWYISRSINIPAERLWRISFFAVSLLCLTLLCVLLHLFVSCPFIKQ